MSKNTRRTIWQVVAVMAVVALYLLSVSVRARAGDTSSGGDTWMQETFESAGWYRDGTWHNWLAGDYVSTTQTSGVLGNGAQLTMKRGYHDFAMLNYRFSEHGQASPDEAYFRYWVKFDKVPPSSGKLPGFMGMYSASARGGVKPTESLPGWSARVLFGAPPSGISNRVGIGYYAYSLDQPGANGEGLWWDTTLPVGGWSCVEGRVSMNTPGVADGELEAWVDGEQVFTQDDFLFRSASQRNVHVREFMFELHYGGVPTPPYDIGVAFDELVIGDHRLGCGDSELQGTFVDTSSSVFEPDIEWLAATGITKGCNPDANTKFCPDSRVTRGQMSAFLHRALGDLVDLPPGPPAINSPPTMWGIEADDYKGATSGLSAAVGVAPDFIQVKYPLDRSDWDWDAEGPGNPVWWIPMQLDNIVAAGGTPVVSFRLDDLDGFNAGRYDHDFGRWLGAVIGWTQADPNNRLLLIPFGGANNEGVAWGGDADAFTVAYRKVVDEVHAYGIDGTQVRFVYQVQDKMHSSRYDIGRYGNGYGLYYPGADYVDLAAIQTLNDGTPIWENWNNTYDALFAELNHAIGDGVPLLLGATASIERSGETTREEWLDMLVQGINESDVVSGFIYMDRDRGDYLYGIDGNGVPDPAFVNAVQALQSHGDAADWIFDGGLDDWSAAKVAVDPGAVFSDDDSVFEADIAWMAATGITRGCGGDRFCPDSVVTRGQMAAFLHRALGDIGPVTMDAPQFSDTGASVFESDIAWLAATGITRGCGGDRFCPDSVVTRGQMAAFLHRALGGRL